MQEYWLRVPADWNGVRYTNREAAHRQRPLVAVRCAIRIGLGMKACVTSNGTGGNASAYRRIPQAMWEESEFRFPRQFMQLGTASAPLWRFRPIRRQRQPPALVLLAQLLEFLLQLQHILIGQRLEIH